jgi:hypothetical protein
VGLPNRPSSQRRSPQSIGTQRGDDSLPSLGVALDQESTDILSGALQLAREVTKESLTIYVAERMAEQQQHEQVLETIEELLQENIKDAKNNGALDQ